MKEVRNLPVSNFSEDVGGRRCLASHLLYILLIYTPGLLIYPSLLLSSLPSQTVGQTGGNAEVREWSTSPRISMGGRRPCGRKEKRGGRKPVYYQYWSECCRCWCCW